MLNLEIVKFKRDENIQKIPGLFIILVRERINSNKLFHPRSVRKIGFMSNNTTTGTNITESYMI